MISIKHMLIAMAVSILAAGAFTVVDIKLTLNRQEIVVLRTYVSTNLVSAGYYGSSSSGPKIDNNGYIQTAVTMNADLADHPPIYRTVTNYVLGYRGLKQDVEVFTAEK